METIIIKKEFLIILSIKKVRGNLGAHTSVIQELENRQEDRSLELFLMAMEAKCDFYATRGNPYFSSIEIVILELTCVV